MGIPGVMGLGQLLALFNAGTVSRLGGTVMQNAGLASDVVSWIGQFDNIFVLGGIPNYQGADAASFRFGNNVGVVDTGANYWWRSLFVPAGSQTISENAGGAAATLIQMGEATAQGRAFAFHMINFPTKNKTLKAWNAVGLANSSVVGAAMLSLEGGWSNVAGPVQCMQMITLSKNMGPGANFSVWGVNSQNPY